MNSKFFIGFGIVFLIFLMTFVNADWLMFHHDPQQTGYAEESSAPGINHTVWNFSSRLIHSSPIITQGMVIITSTNDNKVYALNEANGSIIWNVSIPDLGWNYTYNNWMFFNSFSPAVADNIVFVGNAKCKIYALNLSTGASVWNSPFSGNGMTASLLAVQNGRLIFRCHDDGWNNDTVYLLDSNNGNSISANKFPCLSGDTINPAISSDNLMAYMTIYPCTMSSVNLTTGKINWNFTVQEGCGDVGLSHPILINDLLIFGSDKGYVYFVNVSDPLFPSLKNKTFIGEFIGQMAPAVWKDMIFFGTGYRMIEDFNPPDSCQLISKFGNFYAMNLTNNSIAWTFPIGDAIQSSPAVADGKVFFLAENNIFYALNVSNGASIWNYTTKDTGCAFENDAYTSSPAVSDGVVVIGVPEGKVYAFKTIQLVFVKVAWDDTIANFNNAVQQHANYFLEKSGLNACGMRVEIKRVNVNVSDVDLNFIVNDYNNPNTNGMTVLEKIKDWALKNGVKGDRYIGLTTLDICYNIKACGYTQLPYDKRYDTAIVQYLANDPAITSHELGHTYKLCDEYYQSYWNWEDANLSFYKLGGCPNHYACATTGCSCTSNTGVKECLYGFCGNNSPNPLPNCGTEGYPACTPYSVDLYYYLGNSGCSYFNGKYYWGQTGAAYRMCWNPEYIRAPGDCTSSSCNKCACTADILNRWRISFNQPERQGYGCATGQCNGTNEFMCYGYKFNDDTYSIMGPASIPKSNYSPESKTHLDNVLCQNHGFVALPPLETYPGSSGTTPSKYVTKTTDQKDSNYLKVSFVVRKDGTGSFKNVEILKNGQIADVPRGDYSIVLKNNKREALYTKSFGVSFVTMGDPPKIYNETYITFTISYVNGAKSMEIRKGDKVLFSTHIPVINNGGFETRDFTGWISGGPGDHKVDTQVPYTDKYSALIGFRDHSNVANGYDYIYQTIEVPLGKESELSSYYRFYSYDYCSYDFFTMYIKDEKGNVLATPVNRCLGGNGLEDTGWTNVKYNLTPYAGQKIQIYFEVSNRYDTAYNSWAYVDNVTVTSTLQPINNGFETGNLTSWNVGGDGCYPNWVTIANISAKPGLVRNGNYAAVGNAAWTGSYSNSGGCAAGWYCPEDAILTKQIKVPTYNITGGFYIDFFTMIQTGSQWQSQARVTVKDLTTGEVIYAKGNGAYSGYYGLECPPGNCNAGGGNGCTEPNDNWQYHHAPLTGRENHTIELQFRSHNGCWCSLFYVDDVCISDKDGACI